MRGFPSDAVLRMLEPSRPKSGGFFAFKNIFVSWLVFLKKLVGWKVKPLYRIQSWEQKKSRLPRRLGGILAVGVICLR
jgi:hypothetical protein